MQAPRFQRRRQVAGTWEIKKTGAMNLSGELASDYSRDPRRSLLAAVLIGHLLVTLGQWCADDQVRY
jgi:hypothetical protein